MANEKKGLNFKNNDAGDLIEMPQILDRPFEIKVEGGEPFQMDPKEVIKAWCIDNGIPPKAFEGEAGLKAVLYSRGWRVDDEGKLEIRFQVAFNQAYTVTTSLDED